MRDGLGKDNTDKMATPLYIQGLSRSGFRVLNAAGGQSWVKKGVNVQVDVDAIKTELLLAGERENFVRTSGSGATTVSIVGLSRKGFRIPNSGGAKVICNIAAGPITIDLTNAEAVRLLRRNKRDYVCVASQTAAVIRGVQAQQNGFYVTARLAASATLSSTGTNPAVGDTVTINDKTYRFESTLAQANDVKIGANSDATMTSLSKAVNQNGTVGTDYFTGTTAPTGVSSSTLQGTGATGKLVFTATTPGTAGNAFPSTDTSAQLSFGATTFTGGAQSGAITPVYRGVSVTIDLTIPFNYQQLRRFNKLWIEG